MKKLSLTAILALVLVVAAGAFAVQAAPPTPTPAPVIRPSFTDGRINAFDPGAPVAIFETRKTVPIIDSNGLPTTADVVNGVQLLFWDGSSAKQVLDVSLDQINAAVNQINGVKTSASSTNLTTTANSGNSANTSTANTSSANTSANGASTTTSTSNKTVTTKFAMHGDSVVIAKSNGYTLNYSKTGYFWISTPPDFEGKVYTFSWQKDF